MLKTSGARVGESEKREALERVLSSSAFHRTDQLKSLLRYVCEREIAGEGGSLDECTVAVEALGRSPDYSPFEDGTVRNRVHNLRRRLENYYTAEDPADPVQIVLPKGSYRPVFERREVPVQLSAPAVAEPSRRQPEFATPPQVVQAGVASRTVWILCALAVLAGGALATGFEFLRDRQKTAADPTVIEAWGPLLAHNSNPLLCLATAAQLTLIQRPNEPHTAPSVSSPDLLSWYGTLKGLPPSKEIFLSPSLTSPFWGDVAGALAVGNLMSSSGITPEVLPESAIQMPALNRRNLVMFGRPGFSNTVDHYLAEKPFRVRIPDENHTTVIWNVHPRPGEPAEWDAGVAPGNASREIAYGLITVMPSAGDSALRTVVLSGTFSPGTQAAAEYFTSGKQLQSLLRLFRAEGYEGFPASYQVIVRSHVFGTSALDVEYVTHRVIAKR